MFKPGALDPAEVDLLLAAEVGRAIAFLAVLRSSASPLFLGSEGGKGEGTKRGLRDVFIPWQLSLPGIQHRVKRGGRDGREFLSWKRFLCGRYGRKGLGNVVGRIGGG